MVWGLSKHRVDNGGQLLGHPICNRSPTGNNGSKGVPTLYILGRPLNFGATALVGYTFL